MHQESATLTPRTASPPSAPPTPARENRIGLRAEVFPSVKEALFRAAAAEGLSASALTNRILMSVLLKDGHPAPISGRPALDQEVDHV